ncbi:MAG: hypothetical protein RR971_07395 [Alistipes sp.]
MENLTGYIPETIEVIIPKVYDKVPHVLFDGAKSLEDVQKILHKEFVTTNERVKVLRKLDAHEVRTLRGNYSELLEKKLPIVKEDFLRISEDCKAAVTEAKDKLNACETNINDLVKQVRDGTKEVTFEQDKCYRIPVCGYYLFFAWVNEIFTLVSVETIPQWDADKIFSQGEKNIEAFKSVFGIDITTLIDERAVQPVGDFSGEDNFEVKFSDEE